MISKTDLKAQIAQTQSTYSSQKLSGREGNGSDNLVVDGSGIGNISTTADETVILLADGDDFVFADSDDNWIESKAGNNTIVANGDMESILTDNGDNKIKLNGNSSFIHTLNGDNNIDVTGSANKVTTKNGDNDILSIGASNEIDAEDGNNKITSVGSFNKISATGATDFNKITSFGNNNEITASGNANYITSGGDDNLIIAKDGTNQIISGAYKQNDDGTLGIDEYGKGNNNVIWGGSGKDTIYTLGDNNSVYGREGDDEIHSRGDNNKFLGGLGNDKIYTTGNGNYVDGQEGNDGIVSSGNNNKIFGSDGNDVLKTYGNGNKVDGGNGVDDIYSEGDRNTLDGGNGVDIIQSFGDFNKLFGGNDDKSNAILSIGKHNDITGANGSDDILSIGDYANIDAKDGNNRVVFNGNHQNITVGDGNNSISTLDFAIMNQNGNSNFDYAKYANYLNDQTTVENYSELLSTVKTTEEIGRTSTVINTDVKTVNDAKLNAESILNQLPANERALADKVDFTQRTADGKPKYVLAYGGDNKLHLYQHSSGTRYKPVVGSLASVNSNVLNLTDEQLKSVGTNTATTTTTITERVIVTTHDVYTKTYQDYEKTTIKGNEDVNINIGTGSNNIAVNVSKDLTIDGASVQINENGEFVNDNPNSFNNIFVTGSIVSTVKAENTRQEKEYGEMKQSSFEKVSRDTTTSGPTVLNASFTNAKAYDPLVVDFNRNGVISATTETGVDVDGDGIADGAATNGDKMLAMSDMNGNGIIDGSEIFGNQTVSPFTGQVLDAANGFEALKLIAQEAEEYTGISCINNGDVDLAQLQKALQKVGRNIGFISDGNVTNLESLGHVASINVDDYSNIEDDGEAQYRQTGHYTDNQGNQYQAGDFWFRSKKA